MVISYCFILWPSVTMTLFMLSGKYHVLLQRPAGKLHCKIDKIAGVLETRRLDKKNALYQATIKHVDFLLNRIQKLSRVIDL